MTPIRMCVNCRGKRFQRDLLRLQVKNGKVVLSDKNGRSFYLCAECASSDKYTKKISKLGEITHLKEFVSQWQNQQKQR